MNNIEFKKFRKKTKLTQKQFADRLGITDRTIQKWEKGDAEISKKQILRIMGEFSSYFDEISSSNTNSVNSLTNAVQVSDKTVDYFINNYGNKFYVKKDGSIEIEVINIPLNIYPTYIEMYNDDNKLREVFVNTRFYVDQIDVGNFRSFTVIDEAMNNGLLTATPAGAKVLGCEIQRELWSGTNFSNDYGFLILTNQSALFRDIDSYNLITKEFVLIARNKDYDQEIVDAEEVLQIFKVVKREF